MAKLQFYPLDITYKVVGNKPRIFLFGRTPENRQICVIDDNFQPYFYIQPIKGEEIEEVAEKVKQIRTEKKGVVSSIIKTELVSKKHLGKQKMLIKAYTLVPGDITALRPELTKVKEIESLLEADILFTRRYLIDKGIVPLTLTEVDGEPINLRLKVPSFSARSIRQESEEMIQEPAIIGFDIETYNASGKGIDMEKNPILMIALYGKKFRKVITWKRFDTEERYIEFVSSEEELITKFKEAVESSKPDILCGYFSDGFDMPYIRARAEKYKIKLDIGLDYSIPKSKTGKEIIMEIPGIVHIDIFKFIRRIMRDSMDIEAYSLNKVAEELLGIQKDDIDIETLADVWDNEPKKLAGFCKYNLRDAELAYELCIKIMPNLAELVKLVGLPMFDLSRMAYSQLVEWYLIKRAKEFNIVAPNKPEHKEIKRRLSTEPYEGAFVYEPKPGLYSDIFLFDFRSLYPTIISAHNISPSTINCDCCDDAERVPLEGQDIWFCKKKKGFIPTVIEDLITRRMRIKEILKKKEGEEQKFLYARQYGLKTIANSMYGYLGFYASRWYSKEAASSITAFARHYIKKAIKEAQDEKFEVIYSDTDSVFLVSPNKKEEEVKKFAEKVNADLPGLMELEYEGHYPTGIFVPAKDGGVGAKKKYALISDEGKMIIKGFETVRRNWSTIAKETQEEVLNIVLREKDADKAVRYIKKVISDLNDKKIPMEKMIITTQLQKEISQYESVGPHVFIAKRMRDKGMDVGPGSIIRYIITKGKEKIRDKAKLPEECKEGEYDSDYYLNNQIIPSVEKIFEVLNHPKEELFKDHNQSELGKFF